MKKALTILIICATVAVIYKQNRTVPTTSTPKKPWPPLGEIAHTYNNIPIYSNGEATYKSHGKHYAKDGYYYGKKWQCVEFIKRYYHHAHNHHMPDTYGHAKDFYDTSLPHGKNNPSRNMVQYKNNSSEPPKPNDLLVWNSGKFGHVAIITQVTKNSITVVQQNVKNHAIQTIPYVKKNKTHQIITNPPPVGWLRLKKQ